MGFVRMGVVIYVLAVCSVCVGGQMSWLDNGEVRLGIDLEIGGSITYLADSNERVNVINSHDWGRQVQMSFYGGPNPFEPGGKKPTPAWASLGWNPIQSGDCFGHRSEIVVHENDGKSIHVKCVPMHWPLEDQPGECTFECWFTLEGRAVRVRSRLNNARSDETQYPARSQELPAVYTNGVYHKLMTYDGDEPFRSGALTEIPKQNHPPGGIRWAHWTATENWAALVNENDWGLGVWNPGVYDFIGGFAGKPGAGGPKDGPTGYIAPLHRDLLDYNIQYEYRYVLILDSLENIREYIYRHSESPAPPRYVFENDRRHWISRNAVDAGWPIRGHLQVTAAGRGMELIGPPEFFAAEKSHKLRVTAAVERSNGRGEVEGRLYFKTLANNGFSAAQSVGFDMVADGGFHQCEIDLGGVETYAGTITALRLDPIVDSEKGDVVKLKAVVIE